MPAALWSAEFEKGVDELEHGAEWASESTASFDLSVAAPNSTGSLSMWAGTPAGSSFTRAGLQARIPEVASRPSKLRFYTRVAETQLTKGWVLLCGDENGACDDGRGVAAWFYIKGTSSRSGDTNGEMGITDGERFLGKACSEYRWHQVEIRLDWNQKSLQVFVDGNVGSDRLGMSISFRDPSVESIKSIRIANQDFAQVWFDSIGLYGKPASAPPTLHSTIHPREVKPEAEGKLPFMLTPGWLPSPLPPVARQDAAFDGLSCTLTDAWPLLSPALVTALAAVQHDCGFPTVPVKAVRGQSGLIVYRKAGLQLSPRTPHALLIAGCAYPAQVFLNHSFVGTAWPGGDHNASLSFDLPSAFGSADTAELNVLMFIDSIGNGAPNPLHVMPQRLEAFGGGVPPPPALDFAAGQGSASGGAMSRQLLGITHSVQLDGALLFDWKVSWLPLPTLRSELLPDAERGASSTGPAIWRGELQGSDGIERLAATFSLQGPAASSSSSSSSSAAAAAAADSAWRGAIAFVNGVRVGNFSTGSGGAVSLRLLPGHLQQGSNEVLLIAGCSGGAYPEASVLAVTAVPCEVTLFQRAPQALLSQSTYGLGSLLTTPVDKWYPPPAEPAT